MKKNPQNEMKVGFFVVLGIALTMISIVILGGSDNLLTRKHHYVVHFDDANGLIPGAKVVIGGMQVGAIDSVEYDEEKRDIRVVLNIAKTYSDWVRTDSSIEVLTQGMLGDKYLAITRGSPEQALLPSNSTLPYKASSGLGEFISKSDQLLMTLQSIANSTDRILKSFEANRRGELIFQNLADTSKNLSAATQKINQELDDLQLKRISRNINSILDKINSGQGTLGALLNDPGLYDDMKSLMGGANRNRLVRNLVRQTIKNQDQAEAKAQEEEKKSSPKR